MGPFQFNYGPRVISGVGTSSQVGDLLPDGPLLFVTDALVRRLGLANATLAALGRRNIILFDAVEADPSRATLDAAIAAGRDAVGVIGFGGGSPMDVAKLAAYILGSGDELDAIWGVGKAKGSALPLVLVPTTAGTGSEATPVSIITLADGTKAAVSSSVLVARYAVLDPALSLGMPRAVTAATGIDAMVHAIEAYTSAHLKNPLSDMLASEALRLLSTNLLTVCDNPQDLEARSAMLLGAHLAGAAFANSPVGGVHALAYPLGGLFHVPHGLSNALVLPHVLRHNLQAAEKHYAALARIIDPSIIAECDAEAAAKLIDQVVQLSRGTGLPTRLSDAGVLHCDLPILAEAAMQQTRLLAHNPCPITFANALKIYEAAL